MDAPEIGELPRELVFVDLETTGGHAARHRITEIGIVRVRDEAVVEEWTTLINPECVIPPGIQSFTGITNEMVEAAPRFAQVAALVLEKLGAESGLPALFAAHNARFDYSFLRAEFRRVGIQFTAPVMCTVKLSRRLFPEHVRHSLDAVMERHALTCRARHRALGDARVLSDFWAQLLRSVPRGLLAAACRSVRGVARLPERLPPGLADELPDGPGVYRFYALDGAPLLVGRSGCLRSAVLAHFGTGRSTGRDRVLEAEVARIDWLETAGELGAMLRELTEVRALEPRYNRRGRAPGADCTLRFCAHSGAVRLTAIDAAGPEELAACHGVFHSQNDARKALEDIARAKRLCRKVLGLEPSEGSCIAHQLGGCKGACVGREPRILHDLRVQTALAPLKFKGWPFPGRIALVERGAMGSSELHVLDHWCYLGSARDEEELASLAVRAAPRKFDAHVYRLLVRYFEHHPKPEWRELGLASALDSADAH